MNVRFLSLPVSTRIVARLQVPFACCWADEPSAVEVSPVGTSPEAFTDLQLTLSIFVTVACCVCRSKPTPVRSWAGRAAGPQHREPDQHRGPERDQDGGDDLAQVLGDGGSRTMTVAVTV